MQTVSAKFISPNISFTFQFEGNTIHASNILFEQITRTIPAHSHGINCYEIHYISSGYGTLHANNTDYSITPNTLYVTGPYVEHSQTPNPENPMQEYCIYFRFPQKLVANSTSPIINLFTSNPFWFGQDTQNISLLLHNLFSELVQQPFGYMNQSELLLTQLIILIARNYCKQKLSASIHDTKPQAENKSLIIEKYFLYEYQNASLDDLSNRLGVSPRQTQRLLLQYYGKTFQQKKTDAKMSVATTLLQDNHLSISSIADTLGYSSLEHFSGAFKAYYQKSPREYRKTLQKSYT